MEEKKDKPLFLTQGSAIPFDAKKAFPRYDNFQCNAIGFPSKSEFVEWNVEYAEFERELEDLMRKYKINQVVASIFSKL